VVRPISLLAWVNNLRLSTQTGELPGKARSQEPRDKTGQKRVEECSYGLVREKWQGLPDTEEDGHVIGSAILTTDSHDCLKRIGATTLIQRNSGFLALQTRTRALTHSFTLSPTHSLTQARAQSCLCSERTQKTGPCPARQRICLVRSCPRPRTSCSLLRAVKGEAIKHNLLSRGGSRHVQV